MALAVAVLLPLVAVPLSFLLQWRFGVVACVYLISNVLYSFWLKNVVIVDVLLLAAGYVLRVAAGVALITVERFSPWLYICITLLALFMGFGKRRGELVLLGGAPAGASRKVLQNSP